ncbi:hypothetical protein SMACR_01591 [Sordaria macrospora]|uniref:WGS project CABT00000000 data, contig 2.4 n=2 Tax=Sordaria macrospora TaxID=5147 RepID=F7VR93_SORMK|nr:uncharacterized protein SMAC_01591 [Sordaria macrospora k-hell]KAA8635302.1 hypothetical protein SMACR_01591 [Sordaria macrospora]KAH7634705.1 hypothetical protein B0T09DRAFT_10433 [Sordaria sp. MPI-SDFR-AT-0083]WPJ58519.1 hypothetical protein SMAC4_01591 [Sordaria macrospora]CCC08027.1 unnamed protein product [Sordaria macrospora k-hell]
MTRTNRSEAFRIHHQGFVYFPYMPPSEQYPVLAVTRKFGRKPRIEPEDVDLTQREMTGFASVYPRLHQVPKTMHERLARWYLANRKLADSWPLDGFWNAAEDDAHDEVVVREPGVPPEVKKMAGIEDKPKPAPAPKEKKQKLPKPQREKPTQSRPSTSNTSKATPFPPSVVVRCQELEQWSQQEYFTAELKAAERSFSYIRGWVEDAQNGGRSPSKVQLDELLSFASSALTRASEAVKISSAVMDDLGSAPAPLVHPAFMAWQQQQQHQEEQQQQTMGTSVENRKRPFEVTGDEGIQAGPSGVGKIRKLSPYRSTAEARSRDPPIHPGFLQQFASQQPGPVPTSHTHSSFMVAPMHGSASGYLPMGDDNDGQHQESASESGGESGDEEEDEEDDDEEQEDDDGGDGEDEGDNSDDDASG